MRGEKPRWKNLYQTCPSQSVQVFRNFVQLVLVLDQICSTAQLFRRPFRATFKRKPNDETALKIAKFSASLGAAADTGNPPRRSRIGAYRFPPAVLSSLITRPSSLPKSIASETKSKANASRW